MPAPSSTTAKKARKSRAKPKEQHKQCGWATWEYNIFLEAYLQHYKEAQASCKFEPFWKEVDNAFNEKWPPEDMAERKKVCIIPTSVIVYIPNCGQNLHSWFNNKGRMLAPKRVKTNIFQLKQTKRNKLRHDFQAFSKLYYKECIRDRAEKAYTDAKTAFEQGQTETVPHSLTIRQAVTKAVFQEADAAAKENAQNYRLKWNKAIEEGKDLLEKEEIDDDEGEEDQEDQEERLHIAALCKCWG